MTDHRPTAPVDVEIRLAAPDEFARIGALTHAAYHHDYDITPSYSEELLDPEGRLDEYDIWVVADRATGELLATVSVLRPGLDAHGGIGPDELYFRLLAVSPTARRRGIGARLTRHVFDIARERGLGTVTLHSGEDMLAAHALYRSLGFARDESRDMSFEDERGVFTIYTFTLALADD